MPDVRRELELLASSLEFPETPDLAAAVAGQLEAEARVPRLRLALPPLRRPLLLAALLVVLAAGTVFAAVPAVRHAVLDFLHLRGATIERSTTTPDLPTHRPALGSPLTLAQAQAAVPFRILVPARYGPPDTTRVRGDEVSLVYRPRARLPRTKTMPLGLLVSEFRGTEDPDYVGKVAGPRTHVRTLRLGGRRAIWVSGAPHFFFYRSPDGRQRFETGRAAANVLLLEHGPLLIRFEGAFGLREAQAIAASLR